MDKEMFYCQKKIEGETMCKGEQCKRCLKYFSWLVEIKKTNGQSS